jgi:uncharacterized protein YacL
VSDGASPPPPGSQQGPRIDLALLTLRAVFFASAVGLALYLTQEADKPEQAFVAMVVAGGLASLVIAADALAVARSNIATVSAIVFGLLVGFLTAQLFVGIVSLLVNFDNPESKDVLNGIRLATTLIFCYLGPAYLLRTKDDFRFIVPYVEFQRQGRGPKPLILDTSAIIDGRVVDLAQAGLFDAPFVVHRGVVEELQRIADSGDKNKVAELEDVPVLNLNEVAQGMRPEHLPGDPLQLKIVRQGDGPNQGVGYLDDGTMVVVNSGREFKGKSIQVVVTKSIQSSAGRMLFAKPAGDPGSDLGKADDAKADEPTDKAGDEAKTEAPAPEPAKTGEAS